MPTKICSKCAAAKLLSEFHASRRATGVRSARGGYGVAAECKQCRSESRKPGLRAEREAAISLAAQGMKSCGVCGTAKPISDFNKRAASPDGHAYKCRCCSTQFSTTWRAKNPESWQEWYLENRDERLQYHKKWSLENRELRGRLFAAWAKANPDKVNALRAKRIASKLNATPAWANQIAIRKFYAEAARLTKETGTRHDVDHIVPLQSRIVAGLHWEGNLQVLPKAQNISKLNRYWPDMPA